MRKSRADKELEALGEVETLKRHKQILLDIAKKQNLNIIKIYEEVVSGETISARPEMQKLINDVYDGKYQGVLVVEIERLARGNTLDQGTVAEAFKFTNTRIITPNKVYNPNNEFDEEYFEFGLFMARREYKAINRRIQAGRLSSVNEGKFVGSVPPYGYTKIKLEKQKGWSLKIHEEQAKIVKLIFKAYTNGIDDQGRIGTAKISNLLNNLNILPAKGDVWVTSSIQGILQNPVYIGKIRWNSRKVVKTVKDGKITTSRPRAKEYIIVDGLHESIIDEKTFSLAQKYLYKNKITPVSKAKELKNPLAGLVTCSACKRKMVRRPYKHQEATFMCSLKGCSNVSSPLIVVEERLFKTLEGLIKSYEFKNKELNTNEEFINIKQAALKTLSTEKEKLEIQLNNLHDLLEQGIYDKNKFIERSNLLNNNLKKLNSEIELVALEISKLNKIELEINKTLPKLKNLKALYEKETSIPAKNRLLKEVIENIVYTKNKNCRWHHSLDDFELIVYPKIPQ